MAFDFKYLCKVNQSQDFDFVHNNASGPALGFGVRVFTFDASATGANNSTAQTQAADYFLSATGYLRQGDIIYVYSNNPGYHILNIAVSNGVTVTTAQIV